MKFIKIREHASHSKHIVKSPNTSVGEYAIMKDHNGEDKLYNRNDLEFALKDDSINATEYQKALDALENNESD